VFQTSSGSFGDGSGGNAYADGSDCNWIIAPSGATTITLNFDFIDTEAVSMPCIFVMLLGCHVFILTIASII
jgi:hypothetical protein